MRFERWPHHRVSSLLVIILLFVKVFGLWRLNDKLYSECEVVLRDYILFCVHLCF